MEYHEEWKTSDLNEKLPKVNKHSNLLCPIINYEEKVCQHWQQGPMLKNIVVIYNLQAFLA